MMQDTKALQEDLQVLHGKLRQVQSLDEEGENVLRAVRTEITRLLGDGEGAGYLESPIPLSERLSVAVEDLEEQHPTLVTLMRDVSDMLSNLGI
ncbi:MAG: DUF4404 family protein [Lentisphaerae bacterium]|nr:DUF4404 family protein [Lentisphaerota bacterium]